MSVENEMSDATFGKIFAGLIAGMVGLTVVLIILAYLVGGSANSEMSEAETTKRDAEIEARIAPVGEITVGQVAAVTAPAAGPAADTAAVSGESVYTANCAACHAAGVAGAPKFGDTAAWADRIGQELEGIYGRAINGYQGKAGYMPPKGGNASLSDDAVKAAVDHMLQAAR